MKMKAVSKSKTTKAKPAKKSTPKPPKRQKAPKKAATAAPKRQKTPKKAATVVRKKAVKAALKKVAGAPKRPKTPKTTATSVLSAALKTPKMTTPGNKIKNVKPKPVINLGAVGPSPKPIKKTTQNIKAEGGIPGTSKNTEQVLAKKKAPKRKLDQPNQPKQVGKALETSSTVTDKSPGNKIKDVKPTAVTAGAAGPSSKPVKKRVQKVKPEAGLPGTSKVGTSANKRAPKRKLDQQPPAFPGNKKIKKDENKLVPVQIHHHEYKQININQTNPAPLQENYSYPKSKKEPSQAHSQSTSKVSSVPDGKAEVHFVDKHREALISRVTPVEPILDTLKSQKLLSNEQYDIVCNKPTSQEKMRELYRYIEGFGKDDKDKLYEVLKKHNAPLIKALEEA